MNWKTRFNPRYLALIGAATILALGFQNCGQAGDIALNNDENGSLSEKTAGTTLDIEEGHFPIEGHPSSVEDDPDDIQVELEEDLTKKFACGNLNVPKGILICHVPPGNPEAAHTLCVSVSALRAHMNHGQQDHVDELGPCDIQVSED